MPDKTVSKTEKHLFKPGKSGNPAGRPKGTKNKLTIAAQSLLKGEAEALTRKAVEMALNGDIQALRLCIERLLPPVREPLLEPFKMPSIKKAESLPRVTEMILKEVAAGNLTPGQGESISRIVEQHRKSLELNDLELRLKALERAAEGRV
ncbi:MAG: hypothetical protein HQK62_07345 [Desulfamplus sp.]|nr:hypothetical protein [Desulfamplus sp.]